MSYIKKCTTWSRTQIQHPVRTELWPIPWLTDLIDRLHSTVNWRINTTFIEKQFFPATKWIDIAGQIYAFLWTLRSLYCLYSKDAISSYKAAAVIQRLVGNCLLQQPVVSLHTTCAHRKLHVALKYSQSSRSFWKHSEFLRCCGMTEDRQETSTGCINMSKLDFFQSSPDYIWKLNHWPLKRVQTVSWKKKNHSSNYKRINACITRFLRLLSNNFSWLRSYNNL